MKDVQSEGGWGAVVTTTFLGGTDGERVEYVGECLRVTGCGLSFWEFWKSLLNL